MRLQRILWKRGREAKRERKREKERVTVLSDLLLLDKIRNRAHDAKEYAKYLLLLLYE